MPIQKLSAQNNGWTKKEARIFRRNSVISWILHLAGLESAIMVKRHLIFIWNSKLYVQANIAKILLNEGYANPRAIDTALRTPLHEACQEGNTLVAKILLETAQDKFGSAFVKSMMHDRDDGGATPLLLAVGKGGTSIVHLLLSFHANPNQRNKENVFPVHSAARTGNLDTLALLCQVWSFKNTMG